MFVILNQDVPQVGQKNALVNVSKGYFMNFLSPRKLAQVATADMIEQMKESILAQKDHAAQSAKSDHEHADNLKGASVTIHANVSDKGTLFKALVEKDVVAAIKDSFGFEVEESQLTMDHLKKIGEHAVAVRFGDEMIEMKVVVEAESES